MNANQQQSEAWNGSESVHWVDHADRYDRQLAPFADALFARVQLEPRHAVLDVGCGRGATTLTAARGARTALGVDISKPAKETIRVSLTERHEPGAGVRLGTGAWLVSAHK